MKKNKWFLLLILYTGAVMVSFNQMKVPTLMGTLSEYFNVPISTVSLLMTGFTAAGIVLALPSAIIVNKIGLKKTGLFLMGFMAVGSFIGAAAPNFSIMLIGRTLEGISYAFMILLGAMLITKWFPEKQVGIAMGIFTTFPAVGPLVMFNLTPGIAENYGWQTIWVVMGILSAAAFVLYALFIHDPSPAPVKEDTLPAEKISIFAGFTNARAWMLSIMQGAVAFVLFSYITVYPLIFENFYHLTLAEASHLASYSGLFGIFTCIFSGILISKTGKPALITLVSFICLIVVTMVTFHLGTSTNIYTLHVLASSVFTGLVIPAVLTLPPQIAKTPAQIGTVVAMINFIYYIGVALGTPVTTALSKGGASAAGTAPLVGVAVFGFVASLAYNLLTSAKKV